MARPCRERVGGLGHRERLARQRRLLNLQPHALDDAAVGGHSRPGGENDQIARHQLGRGNLPFRALADDMGDPHRLFLQSGQRLLGLPFGEEADAGVEDDDDQDGDRLDVLAQGEGDAVAASNSTTMRLRNW